MKRVVIFFLLTFCVIQFAFATEIKGFDKTYVYVNFGHYPQGENGEILPIKWRVLSVENEQAYLLSEYVLFNHRIHHDDKEYVAFNGQFVKTDISKILNHDFLHQAFNETEQKSIIKTSEFETVFLASAEDLTNANLGFKTNKDRKAHGTPYALKNGLFQYSNRYGGHSPYWTRSQSITKPYGGRCTKQDGNLGYIRVVVMNEGIRPAMYLNLPTLKIAKGEGTFDSPFEFEGH